MGINLSHQEWLRKQQESKSEPESEEIDEVEDVILDGFNTVQEVFEDDISPVSSIINIVNRSRKTIMITNLFGPSESLVLGSVESESSQTPPPFIQVDSSFRNKLNVNQYYQQYLDKKVLMEVNSEQLDHFKTLYYDRLDKIENERDSRLDDGFISMGVYDGELKGNERNLLPVLERDERDISKKAMRIDINNDIVTPDEDETQRILRENWGVEEVEDMSDFINLD